MTKNQSFADSLQIKRNLWKHHIESWEKSGLAQTEYCRQHSLKVYDFRYWKKRFHTSMEPESPSKLIPVKLTEEVKPGPVLDSSGVSLSLDHRYTIHLAETFNSQTLSKLIDFLEAK